jgi:hypothetical protein
MIPAGWGWALRRPVWQVFLPYACRLGHPQDSSDYAVRGGRLLCSVSGRCPSDSELTLTATKRSLSLETRGPRHVQLRKV